MLNDALKAMMMDVWEQKWRLFVHLLLMAGVVYIVIVLEKYDIQINPKNDAISTLQEENNQEIELLKKQSDD